MRPIFRALSATLVAALAASGCTSGDDPGTADEPLVQPDCRIGVVGQDGVFQPYNDGDKAELVVGFQGFMLIIVRVHTEVGKLPAIPKVRMTVEREGGEPSVSTVVRAGTKQDAQGHDITQQLDMWLYPPDPMVFDGANGSLAVDLVGRDSSCSAKVAVRFVDEELCKHSEDGSVVCVDGHKKEH